METPVMSWEDRKIRFGFVRVGSLKVDHAYQRLLKESKVRKLVKEWNPLRFSPLILSESNNDLWIIDGQNRSEAAKRVNGPDYMVPSMIWLDLTRREQGNGFLGNLLVTRISALDEHKSSLFAGTNPISVQFQEVIEEHGLKTGNGPANGLGSIRVPYQIIEKYGKSVLSDAWTVLRKAFGTCSETWNADATGAVAILLHTFPFLDKERLVEIMIASGTDNTDKHPPINALAMARNSINYMRASGARGSNPDILAYYLAQKYNKRLRATKLDINMLTNVMRLA